MIFFAALTLRLAYVAQIRDNPFFEHPIIDAAMYDARATRISGGDWLGGNQAFLQAPLYSYFLAGLYRLFGRDLYAVRVVQALLGSANCVLICLIGRRVFGATAGIIAGATAAAYGTLIFYDAELMRPVLIITLILLAIWLTIRAGEDPRPARWAAAGFVLGLAAVTQENILLFFPAVLGWLVLDLRTRVPPRKIATAAFALCLAAGVPVLAVTARNRAVSGDPVLISSQGGLNFYIGNNPDAGLTTTLQPGTDYDDLAALPEMVQGLRTASQRSSWFYARAFGWIRANPGAWAGLMLKKLVYFWNAFEADPNNDIGWFRERSSILRILIKPEGWILLPFGVVGPLAVAGLILGVGRSREVLLLRLFVLAYMTAVVLYHVRARYRLPVVPVLILFAAAAISRLFGRAPGRSKLALALASVGIAIFMNADLLGARAMPVLPVHTYLGMLYDDRGLADRAEAEYLEALRVNPADYDASNRLGNLRDRQRRPAEALELYARAVRLKPNFAKGYSNMGIALGELGRRREALAAYRRAIEINPALADARLNLGIAWIESGDLAAARAEADALQRLSPRSAAQLLAMIAYAEKTRAAQSR